MPVYHKTLITRFKTFPEYQQILMIVNELNRAMSQVENPDNYKHHIVLAMELMDFLIRDIKWQNKYKEVLRAREYLGNYFLVPEDLSQYINSVIHFSPQASRMMKGESHSFTS